jgi:hypothetical protein
MKKTTKLPTKRKSKSQKQADDMVYTEYYSRQGRVDSFLIATTCVWAMAAIGMGMLIYLFIFE